MSKTTARSDRSFRRDAYWLSYAAARPPCFIQCVWETADRGSTLPPGVEAMMAEIRTASASLVGAVGGSCRGPAEAAQQDLAAAATEVLAFTQGAWGGDEHRRGVLYRDGAYEVLADHDDLSLNPMTLLAGSRLFEAPCCGRLAAKIAAFADLLPAHLHHLTVLGAATASAFDYGLRHGELVERRGRVERRLLDSSDGRLRPIVRAAMSYPTPRAGQEPGAGPATGMRGRPYFDQTWPSETKLRARLGYLHEKVAWELADPGGEVGSGGVRNWNMATAIGLLAMNPDLPVAEAARLTGVNRTSIHRVAAFKTIEDARAEASHAARQSVPRGLHVSGREAVGHVDGVWVDRPPE